MVGVVLAEEIEMSQNQQIAQTILQQLGAGRFRAMTGAKDFIAIERGLQFGLPARFARGGINKLRITLEPEDTYKVEFMKVSHRLGMHKCETVAEHDGVYCDMLQSLFKSETGLETHL